MKNQIKDGYYYPRPDEVRLGMEVEREYAKRLWKKSKVDVHHFKNLAYSSSRGEVRIPLLTKDQIEREGFWAMDDVAYALDLDDGREITLDHFPDNTISLLDGSFELVNNMACPTIYDLRYILDRYEIKKA